MSECGSLTVVGTPIGNLGDFSPRAVEELEKCDFIAAEDTRITLKLLNHFEIKKPLVSYYEHNKEQRGEYIISRIKSGENCVLVSDAGMPAISDPGELLVAQCRDAGITVTCVPGPTAMATALAVSGLPTGRFTFEGFLSMNKKSRREHLEELRGERRTMIFYEAPHKLCATLNDFTAIFGEQRRITLARELTKLHEQVIRTTLGEAVQMYAENPPRGEFVLVIEGAAPSVSEEISLEEAVLMAKKQIDAGMPISAAAKDVARATGLKKSEIYNAVLKSK